MPDGPEAHPVTRYENTPQSIGWPGKASGWSCYFSASVVEADPVAEASSVADTAAGAGFGWPGSQRFFDSSYIFWYSAC